MNRGATPTVAVEVAVTILVENWVDMLLPDVDMPNISVSRHGLIEHFDTRVAPPIAENGLAILVETKTAKGRTTQVLFDCGLTGLALEHNLSILGVDVSSVDYVVISHGHPDHYGGLAWLAANSPDVPVIVGLDADAWRFAVMADGSVVGHYGRNIPLTALRATGQLVEVSDALYLGGGVWTTGSIERLVDFESPPPVNEANGAGLYIDRAGQARPDEVRDEQGLVINTAEGIVVLTGCAHAGVMNTIREAKTITGNDRVRAVLGGLHLGFPTTPAENVEATARSLLEEEPILVMPMHCSGLATHAHFRSHLEHSYVQPSVLTKIAFRDGGDSR